MKKLKSVMTQFIKDVLSIFTVNIKVEYLFNIT